MLKEDREGRKGWKWWIFYSLTKFYPLQCRKKIEEKIDKILNN